MDLQTTKIVVAVLLGVLRFLFGILPVKLYKFLRHWEEVEDDDSHTFINRKRHKQVNLALTLCQSFGGGVLFATCFLHMMREVYISMEDLKKFGGLDTVYPLSQLTISLGFFFVYFVEEISHWIITKIPEEPICVTKSSAKIRIISKSYNGKPSSVSGNNKITPKESNNIKEATEDNLKEENIEDDDGWEKKIDNEELSTETLDKDNDDQQQSTNQKQEEIMNQIIANEIKTQQQVMRCILIILALSLHAIFEGLAMGLQNQVANIWYLFISTAIHSASILFCVGLELLLAKTKIQFIVIQVTILAAASSFGMFLGLLVTIESESDSKTKSAVVVLLEGLSAGTILYITFFEVLNREKERRTFRMPRALCILGGFGLMAVLQYFESAQQS